MTLPVQQSERKAAVERAVTRIRAANADRTDDFQDIAVGEIRLALDAFRPEPHERQPGIESDPGAFAGDLAATGDDELLDALRELARELDASPETIDAMCDRILARTKEPLAR